MADVYEQSEDAQSREQPADAANHEQVDGSTAQAQPSEEDRSEADQREAYEAELNRITSSEMILQATVSLLNIGGRRLGLAGAPDSQSPNSPAAGERDLEQVRDAIDGVRALMPILERHMGGELGPLRDAISQLQMAYAREVRSARETSSPTASQAPAGEKPASVAEKPTAAEKPEETLAKEKSEGPGPAQASGRLWVPGR
jgi:hypothetical protein